MATDHATQTTADFLYDFAKKANAKPSISITTVYRDNLIIALKNYGYDVNWQKHNADNVWAEIKAKRPVLMGADIEGTYSGHAWIASGGKDSYTYNSYELFTFREKADFSPIYKYTTDNFSGMYLYMNWGWEGEYNGYYYDANFNIPDSNKGLKNREDVFIKK